MDITLALKLYNTIMTMHKAWEGGMNALGTKQAASK